MIRNFKQEYFIVGATVTTMQAAGSALQT